MKEIPILATGAMGVLLWETEREPMHMETRACMRLPRGRLRNRDSRIDSTRTRAARPLGNHLYARWNWNAKYKYLLHYTASGKGHEQRRRNGSSVR